MVFAFATTKATT